jgi:hypothetical protein
MKTSLTPPPITKNWTPGPERVGLLTVETVKGTGKYYQKTNWYVQDDTEAAANFRFFGAAPAMAEALVRAMDALETFGREFNMTSGGLAGECHKALLSAGYTETAADPQS